MKNILILLLITFQCVVSQHYRVGNHTFNCYETSCHINFESPQCVPGYYYVAAWYFCPLPFMKYEVCCPTEEFMRFHMGGEWEVGKDPEVLP